MAGRISEAIDRGLGLPQIQQEVDELCRLLNDPRSVEVAWLASAACGNRLNMPTGDGTTTRRISLGAGTVVVIVVLTGLMSPDAGWPTYALTAVAATVAYALTTWLLQSKRGPVNHRN